MNPSDPFLLFVYGTLKRGGCRHGPLATQTYRGRVRTRPLYALYHLDDYPGLKHAADSGQVVHGELYEVERGLLGWLDAVEGAPDWFALGRIEMEGVDEPVWAYFYQQEPGGRPRVASGVWPVGEGRS